MDTKKYEQHAILCDIWQTSFVAVASRMETNDENLLTAYQSDSKVLAAFKDGSVFEDSDQHLKKFLNTLCSMTYLNPDVRHRAVIMGITLSQILFLNEIRRMNRSNMVLAAVAIGIALLALLKH